MTIAPLATLEAAPPRCLADHLEEVRRPTVCLQVWLPRFVVVRVLWVLRRPAAPPPHTYLRALPLEPGVSYVLIGDTATLLGLEVPVER
jgi:hypothetical protein